MKTRAEKTQLKKHGRKTKGSLRGFTLVEMIMVVAIFSIIMISVSSFTIPTVALWSYQNFQQGPATESRLALKRMVRDISELQSPTAVRTANATRFRFDEVGGSTVDLEYQAGWGELRRNGITLVKDVTNVDFDYYDRSNNLIAAPLVNPFETNIWRIEIEITVSAGSRTSRIRTQVFPRNLAMIA